MRIPRIYYPEELKPNSLINLPLNASNHLKVLKKNKGDKVEVFNGEGHDFPRMLRRFKT